MLRIAIVNDYEVVVRGLTSMFRAYEDRLAVVELDANTDVRTRVDVALYDTFAQEQGHRPDVSKLIRNPRVGKVVVYTWNFRNDFADGALAHGVSGYLSKALPVAELVDALERVHAGETLVSPDPGRRPVKAGDWPGREEGLTARESEVLALITQGMSNQEIADRAGLSINSVKSHIRSCYRKIEVTTRPRAVLWGIAHGFQPDLVRIIRDTPRSSGPGSTEGKYRP